MERYKIWHVQGKELELIYDRIRRTTISQLWPKIYAEGLINNKSEYYIVQNEEGKYAVFSRRNPNTPVSGWFKEIKLEGLASGTSEYYLATNENNQMALFYKSNPSIPITPWWDNIICYNVLLGKSKYFIAQKRDNTTNTTKVALFKLNTDNLEQPIVKISQWWNWIEIPNKGDVKYYYIAVNDNKQMAIFHINDPYEPVSRWWEKIKCDTLLSLNTEYYVVTNRKNRQAVFHIDNPNEPISTWLREIIYPDGLFSNVSDYYVGILEEETNDSKPKIGVFHKDSKDAVSGSWLGQWEEIATKYGLLNGNSDYLLVRNADNKYAIFHKDNPYEPISDWWDDITADGLLKGESEYYIATNQEGKVAIFHKDNPYEPVSQWWDDISINGLLKGEAEYYIATYIGKWPQLLQPNTSTNNIDALLNILSDNEIANKERKLQAIFHKDDLDKPVSGWWNDINVIDNAFEYYIARNQTGQYAIFHQYYPETPISKWYRDISIADITTSHGVSSHCIYYVARESGIDPILHVYQITDTYGKIYNEECYQIEEPELVHKTSILYIDNSMLIYLQKNRLNIYSTYFNITQQILLKNKDRIDIQVTKELIKEYIEHYILPIAYYEPYKSRLYTLSDLGNNINHQNNYQLFDNVQEMKAFLQANYKHDIDNDNMMIL